MATDVQPEICESCGFDGERWSDEDTVRTLTHAGDLVELALAGTDPALLSTRPNSSTWSLLEYADHVREVIFANHFVCATAAEQPGSDLGSHPQGPVSTMAATLDPASTLAGLRTEGSAMAQHLSALAAADWECSAVVAGETWTVGWSARHACHDLFHHLADMADIRARLGDTLGLLTGSVAQLSLSDGGVPKRAVPSADVDAGGLVGDRQATRRHHGRPWQALCLYSADVIDDLVAEGHPIHAGATGENITVAGLDWAALRAGLLVAIGDMTCRLSAPATPCAKNNQWFADRDSRRMSHELHPGWSRWYASVLSPGTISQGDSVTVRSG